MDSCCNLILNLTLLYAQSQELYRFSYEKKKQNTVPNRLLIKGKYFFSGLMFCD